MELRELRYFVIVAEEGSVHAAARRALIAQPALSVALKKLEKEIGSQLFVRSHRGVTLTSAGSALLPHARRMLRLAESAPEVMLASPAAESTFTVGLVEGRVAAAELTGPILTAFQAGHPEISIQVVDLSFVEQFDSVLDGAVDVAIVRSPYVHPDLTMVPLYHEPVLLVGSAAHPLARQPEVSIERLLEEPMLEVVRTPRLWREFWNLSQLRNEAGRVVKTSAVGLIDYGLDLLRNGLVSPMAQSGWRLGGLSGTALEAVSLIDGPLSTAGVGYRGDTTDHRVSEFVEVARSVTSELIDLIPDGRLATLPDDSE